MCVFVVPRPARVSALSVLRSVCRSRYSQLSSSASSFSPSTAVRIWLNLAES